MSDPTATTRRLLAAMTRDDLEVYGAALSLDPTRSDLVDAVLARLGDRGWVVSAARVLPPLARDALVAAAWACPEPVDPLDLLAFSGEGDAGIEALYDLDASGLWLAEAPLGPDDASMRLVPPVAAAVLRVASGEIIGGGAQLTMLHAAADPGARLLRAIAAIADVGGRLRKDGGLTRQGAARIGERVAGFAPGGEDADSLGLLARVALRAGWLAQGGDGRLRLDASALRGPVPDRRDLIGVVAAGAIAAVPPLGPALAALCALPELHAIPLRLYDALLAVCYDARVHALDPGAAATVPPVQAAVGLLSLAGIVLVASHDGELYVLLHPEARSALRLEHRLASVSSPVVQADREVLLQPDCPVDAYWRVASVAEAVAFDVVDRWCLSSGRLQEALDGGLDTATVRGWLGGGGALPPTVDAWLDSARGPQSRCEVLAGVPLRLGADALAALEADPDLGAMVLDRGGALVVLHPDALPLLPAWARGGGIRLIGAGAAAVGSPHAPPRRADWVPMPGRLAALLRALLEPAEPPPFLPGCEDLVYPPLIALGGDDAAADAAERLVSTLLVRAPRDLHALPAPTEDERVAAFEAAPAAWRRLSLVGAIDVAALLAAALAAALPVEVHVALGGRRVVPRVLVPAALEPEEAPTVVFPTDEPAPIRLRDLRAVRLLDPREPSPEDVEPAPL